MGENIRKINHPFLPVYDQKSKILILGSFPSQKSVENNFYYGHPQNRFWPLLAFLLHAPVPETIEEKTNLLLGSKIALWDVLYTCEITGSSDSSIENPVPNDIASLLQNSRITAVFANGRASQRLYDTFVYEKTGIKIGYLPSTSPANAACGFEKLALKWKVILPYLQ